MNKSIEKKTGLDPEEERRQAVYQDLRAHAYPVMVWVLFAPDSPLPEQVMCVSFYPESTSLKTAETRCLFELALQGLEGYHEAYITSNLISDPSQIEFKIPANQLLFNDDESLLLEAPTLAELKERVAQKLFAPQPKKSPKYKKR